jgi:hypothetical protein
MCVLGAASSFAGAAPPEFHDLVNADAPLLWYQFNESPGAAAAVNHGSLGAGFNGVFHNGVTLGVATAGGDTGVQFDALQNQFIESMSAAPAALTGNPTFTAETVVYMPPRVRRPNYAPFLHWGAPITGQSVYFSTWFEETNRAYAGFYNGGLRMRCHFRENQWNHIVWVRDSAGGTNGQYVGTTLYVNGEPVELEQDTVLPGAPVINVTSTTFTIQRATDLDRYFSGAMDEVALYDRALTPDEVQAHYAALSLHPFICHANVNGDCEVNSQDFFDFLSQFFASNADYNDDGVTNSQDFFDFLADFFAGCN